MRILLDMDEIITDFVGAALRVHGWTREQFYAKHPIGTWDMETTLGVSNTKFWKPIHEAGEEFWLNLVLLPFSAEMMYLARKIDPKWYIVTSPSSCPTSYSGKVKWLRENFSSTFKSFVITEHKHLLANPSTILIDDREKNCEAFVAHGGHAIIFPTLHNSKHKFAYDPVTYVKETFYALNLS